MSLQSLLAEAIESVNSSGGVSVDLHNLIILSPKDYWMFPKYPSKTKILPKNIDLKKETNTFVAENRKKLMESNTYLGIWLNPKSNEYYFDITMTEVDKEKALKTARKISTEEGRNIVAIYNPLKKETIYL